MKHMIHKTLLGLILAGGLFIGMVKGEEVKQRWIAKMKNRQEGKETATQKKATPDEVLLDEFEISAYHS